MHSPLMLIFALASSFLLLTACEDQSENDAYCRYYVQLDLDNQEYDSAIDRLDSTTCQETYSNNEYYVDLASAYLGKSGYSFPQILAAALEDGDGDAFTTFTTEVSELKNDDSVEYIDLAEEAFKSYLGLDPSESCDDLTNKTSSEEGICLIQGVLSVTKTAIALDFLAGDLGIEDSETLDLSACALQHSFNGTNSGCTLSSSRSVTFEIPNSTTTNSYTQLEMTDGTYTEYFLETTVGSYPESIIFTDGYCTNDFTATEEVTDDTTGLTADEISYVCPSQNEEDESVNDFVLDALNDAINNIDSLLSSIGTSEEDTEAIKDAIDEFREEIKGSTNTDDFTLEEIIDYLNTLDAA